MKYSMDRGAASALIFSSAFTRLFWGMATDAPMVHNAAWLCPIIGLALLLPIVIIAGKRFKNDGRPVWQQLESSCPGIVLKAAAILIAACFLLDCTSGMRTLAGTANLISMDKISLFYLLLPLALFAAVSILLGSQAAGNCARLWNRLLPLLTAIVLAVHLSSYNIRWLAPVFGNGAGSILRGGVYCASAVSLLSLQWLLAGTNGKGRPMTAILIAVFAASLQLAALQMLSPSLTDLQLSRGSRMQLVLSNGRTAMPLQMLLMLLCYGGFLLLIASEAAACAGFLSRALPKAPTWAFAAGVAIAAIILASLPHKLNEIYAGAFILIFPLIAAIILVLLLAPIFTRRKKTCANQA